MSTSLRSKEYRAEAAKLTGEASIGLMFRHLSASRLITIAQIEVRVRAAGSEFVLACDMRFASREAAIFSQPEPATGVVPGGGGVQHLTRLMGRARALEVMLGAEDYHADLAERYGWVNRALPAEALSDFVRSLAHRVAKFPAVGLVAVKDRVNAIALAPVEDFRRDSDLFGEAAQSTRMDMAMTEARTEAAPARTVATPPAPEPLPDAPKPRDADLQSHSVHHRRRGDRCGRHPVDLLSGARRAAAGAGRGGRNALRHRGAGRRTRRGRARRARPERRRQRRAGADRQSRDARQARAGAGRQGRRRRAARQYQRRHAAGGHRGAQGRARARAGGSRPGAEDLRARPPAGRARQCSAGASRSGDRCAARERARRRPGQIGLRAGGQRLYARGARDRGGECRQGARRHQGRAIDHRSDGGLRAGRLAGLPAQRRARRIRVARRAAGHADRSRRPVDPLRPARGPGQDAEGRRPLRRAHSGARRPPHHRRGQADRHQGRICELARHPRHRRFRPAHLLDPRLSGRQGAGAAARHERLSGLARDESGAEARILAGRPARMAMAAARSRGADPDLRRAAVRFRGLVRGLQSSGDPRSRRGRRRRGPLGDLARLRGAGGGLAQSQHRRAHRRSRLRGAGDPLRRRHRRGLHPGQLRA